VKGFVQFCGFGIVQRVELITQFHQRQGSYFSNYVFDFCILSLKEEDESFDWSWITARRDPEKKTTETLGLAPASWRSWIAKGPVGVERARRRVASLFTVPAQAQNLEAGSRERQALEAVYDYYRSCRERFECLASVVVASIIRRSGAPYREGWLTPASSDGGADFIGRIDLGSGFATAKLIVLGQAKCEKLNSATGGNHIARTVARLRRGWLGAYVTTSYYSESVQREILEDKYPILLVNGKELAREVLLLAQEGGFASTEQYLRHVDGRYTHMLARRQPDEILLD
jgi:hypothetical protein